MNLFAANRDPNAFDHPHEFIPERWMNGRKGRTDLFVEGGDKLGVPHLTYGAGRRVCPGIDSKSSLLETSARTDLTVSSGQPWIVLHAGTPSPLFHLGETASGRGREEARVPSLPLAAGMLARDGRGCRYRHPH